MNRRANIAARIEKNRIALMRLVFCWLALATCFGGRGDKPLPRRLARLAVHLIGKAEKAAGHLLVATFYNGQKTKSRSMAFERAVMRLIAGNACITCGALTLPGLIKRLKALHNILYNLASVARRLEKSAAARVRITAMKLSVLNGAPNGLVSEPVGAPEHAIPP